MSIHGMRPWEWGQADSRDMHMIKTLTAAWNQGYGDAKEAADKADGMKHEAEANRPRPRQRRGRG